MSAIVCPVVALRGRGVPVCVSFKSIHVQDRGEEGGKPHTHEQACDLEEGQRHSRT